MSLRPRRLIRDYAALSAGEIFAKLAGFLAFAYLARALGPDAFGAVELAAALVMVFGLVVDFGFGPIGAREIARDPARARALAAVIPAARLLLALVAFGALALTVAGLNPPAEARRVALLFGVGLLAGPWTLNWLLQGLDRVRWVAPAQALRMSIFAVGVLLLVRGPADLAKVGGVEIAAAFAMAAYFGLVARRHAVRPGLDFDLAALRRLAREALPVGVSQLLWVLNQYLPTLLVAIFVGGAAIAFYGGAHRIVMSLGTFVWLYFFNLYPSMVRSAQASDEGFAALVRHSFRATAWLGILGALVATLLAGPICRLAYGDAFGDAAVPFALLAWVLPINVLSGHARFGLIGAGLQTRELVAQAGGLVVTLGLGLGLVPSLGATGAALAMIASALVVWGIAHVAARAQLGSLPFAGPVLRPAAAAAAAAALFAWLPAGSEWLRAAAATGLYVAAGAVLEPRLLRDLRALVRSAGAATPSEAA